MKLSIPTPCEQPWEGMQSVNGGKFCDRCNKQVVDFTSMSDVEIVKLIKKTKGGVCGRLQDQQIDRELRERERQALLPALVLTSVLSAAIPETSHGQSLTKDTGKIAHQKITRVELKGNITDLHSGEAIPGVTIRLKESNNVGAVTGNDGSFRFDVPVSNRQDSVNLTFSSMGYDVKELTIGMNEMNQQLELALCSKVSELQEVTVVAYARHVTRTVTGAIMVLKGESIVVHRSWWQQFRDLFRKHP